MLTKHGLKIGLIALITMLSITIISFYFTENLDQKITGKTIARVNILETPPQNCYFSLRQGRNLVSLHCKMDEDIKTSLKGAGGQTLDYYAVFKHDPQTTDPWHSYKRELPNWTEQSLQEINRRDGYWILMNKADVLSVEGYNFYGTSINLRQGWNLVGYPSNVEKNITEALQLVEHRIVTVRTYKETNGTYAWLSYTPGQENTIITMQPGDAYWMYVTSAIRWDIDW